MVALHPPIEPWDAGELAVSPLHRVYFEQSGRRDGKPTLFLHGGPGGGCDPKHRRFFDPDRYRIVLFDQRGCGRSRPLAELRENTTWDLVADIERLRISLGIDRWQLFGGSWGSTLALAYAQRHPDRVSELVLRGIFTFTPEEMAWFYGHGTRAMFPDRWADFVAPLTEAEREDPVAAYHRRFSTSDRAELERLARAWSLWECRVATLVEEPDVDAHCSDPGFTVPFALIEAHYFVNGGFLSSPTQLLDGLDAITDIPTTIVHGRYDVICPVENAWRLHQRLPRSRLVIVPDAGHSAFEPGIASALVAATNEYARA